MSKNLLKSETKRSGEENVSEPCNRLVESQK